MLVSQVFRAQIALRNGDIFPNFCWVALGCQMILLNRVQPMVFVPSWSIISQYILTRMCIKGFRPITRLDSWAEQGLHQAFSVMTLAQWCSTNRTCWMLLQPYVYAVHMEGVSTVGEDPQYIIITVFLKTSSAAATCKRSQLVNIKSQDLHKVYNIMLMKKTPHLTQISLLWFLFLRLSHKKHRQRRAKGKNSDQVFYRTDRGQKPFSLFGCKSLQYQFHKVESKHHSSIKCREILKRYLKIWWSILDNFLYLYQF